MEAKKNDIIHIIPFDTGIMFFDELSLNNKDSYELINDYLNILETKFEKSSFEIYRNITVINDENDYKFNDKKMCSEALCWIKLNSSSYGYILPSGIGAIVFADFNSEQYDETIVDKFKDYSPVLQMGYRKATAHRALLYGNEDSAFNDEKNTINEFLEYIWDCSNEFSLKNPKKFVRKKSSNRYYKHNGLSYILSIYLINKETLTDDEIDKLMYSPFWHEVLSIDKWSEINETISKYNPDIEENKLSMQGYDIHFAWTGLAIVSDKNFDNFSDIVNDKVVSYVIKAENYIQARWFLGDCSLDNLKFDKNITLTKLIHMQNSLEFVNGSLDNYVSANTTTFYKECIKRIIDTSEIRPLYKSVLNQIKVQRNLTEAKGNESRKKGLFVSNILVAIFTAFSMYKSINDFISGEFNAKNVILFVATCLLAFGLVIYQYINNKRGS